MKRPQQVHAGQQLSAGDINRLAKEVFRLQDLKVELPLQLSNVGYNPTLRLIDGSLYARITGYSTTTPTAYAWSEVRPSGTGGWTAVPLGRTGTALTNPAFERNNTGVGVGTVVRLFPGLVSEYLFSQCCSIRGSSSSTSTSRSSTSRSSTSSTSCRNATTCAEAYSPAPHPVYVSVTSSTCSGVSGATATLTYGGGQWSGTDSHGYAWTMSCEDGAWQVMAAYSNGANPCTQTGKGQIRTCGPLALTVELQPVPTASCPACTTTVTITE